MIATLLVTTGLMAASLSLPASQGYVNDFAGILDEQTKQDLTTQLRALEADTTAEIAVATVATLEGEPIEEYAVHLFTQWGIGQKTLNNGVLVLVSPGDRRVRIEVGYGLEPILPDGLTGEIIRQQFLPKFRHTDYAGALRDGVTRLSTIIRAKHVVTAEEREHLAAAAAAASRSNDWPFVLLFGLAVAIAGWSIGLGVRAKAMNGILFGLVLGGIGYFVSFNIAPEWTHIILDPIAALFAIVGFNLGKRSSWRRLVRTKSMSRGWVMDGSEAGSTSGSASSDSSSSSGSNGSSSSSDSFGGGSSGGGGASGSW